MVRKNNLTDHNLLYRAEYGVHESRAVRDVVRRLGRLRAALLGLPLLILGYAERGPLAAVASFALPLQCA